MSLSVEPSESLTLRRAAADPEETKLAALV